MGSSSKELKRFWQRHIDELLKSGLSRASYCRQHELNYNQCNYWFARLQKKDYSSKPLTFVPIRLEETTEPVCTSTKETVLCSVVLRNGALLNVYDLSVLPFILERST